MLAPAHYFHTGPIFIGKDWSLPHGKAQGPCLQILTEGHTVLANNIITNKLSNFNRICLVPNVKLNFLDVVVTH